MKNLISILSLALLASSCIERISIKTPEIESQLVVDGLITDEPGPYTVKLSFATPIDGFLEFAKPFTARKVMMFDNVGNEEILEAVESGVYQTKPEGIRGVVGREYAVRIETFDGLIYESTPDKMNPAGRVDSVYYDLVVTQPIDDSEKYNLRIYADGRGATGGNQYYKWKLEGTFVINSSGSCYDGTGCYCCTCWVTRYGNKIGLTDNQFVSNNNFRRIDVGNVPIEYFPFLVKYRMEVKQMSLSRKAFDYWRVIQLQKEGSNNFFQPIIGRARTNIFEKNGAREALGIFYASSVTNKQIYITNYDVKIGLKVRLEVPYWIRGGASAGFIGDLKGIIDEDCRTAYPNSTNVKPADWLD